MEEIIYITTEEAEGILWDGSSLAKEEGNKHRWYTNRHIIFEKNGKFYEFIYMQPASELQEDQDIFEASPVPCYRVEAKQIIKTIYTRM